MNGHYIEIGPNLAILLTPVVEALCETLPGLENAVADLTKAVADLTVAVNAAVAEDTSDDKLIADLEKQVADLEAQIAAGGGSLTQAQEDALGDELVALQGKLATMHGHPGDQVNPLK